MINFISGNGEKISVLEFKLKRIKIQEARKFITEIYVFLGLFTRFMRVQFFDRTSLSINVHVFRRYAHHLHYR